MDIAPIAGLAVAFGLVGFAIFSGAGGLGAFFDVNTIAIVFGGTAGALLMNFPLGQVLGAVGVLKNAFLHKAADPNKLIQALSEMAKRKKKADSTPGASPSSTGWGPSSVSSTGPSSSRDDVAYQDRVLRLGGQR